METLNYNFVQFKLEQITLNLKTEKYKLNPSSLDIEFYDIPMFFPRD